MRRGGENTLYREIIMRHLFNEFLLTFSESLPSANTELQAEKRVLCCVCGLPDSLIAVLMPQLISIFPSRETLVDFIKIMLYMDTARIISSPVLLIFKSRSRALK